MYNIYIICLSTIIILMCCILWAFMKKLKELDTYNHDNKKHLKREFQGHLKDKDA